MPPYIYLVARGDNAAVIIDAANPALPVLAGQINGAGAPNFLNNVSGGDLAATATRMCMAGNNDNAFTVLDVTNPLAPALLSSIQDAVLLSNAFDVSVVGNYAYVAAYGLTIIEITNPALPVIVGSLDLTAWGGQPVSIYVSGGKAYIADIGRLFIIDVSNPAAPALIAVFGEGVWSPRRVTIRQPYAYLSCQGEAALVIVDISNPAVPVQVGFLQGGGAPNFLAGIKDADPVGNYAYCACAWEDAMTVIDITNVAAPAYAGRLQGISAPGVPWLWGIAAVKALGNYAYCGFGQGGISPATNGLTIIDVTNPLIPVYAGSIQGFGAPNFLSLVDKVLLVKPLIVPTVQTLPATGVT